MKSLLWKDYRINRLLLIFGFVVCVGPWVIAIARNQYLDWRYGLVILDPEFWATTASFSLGFSVATFAMLGGNAIAAERADRSAEFLAYLPVSRWTILASKSILALSTGAAIWLVNLVAVLIAAPRVAVAMSAADVAANAEIRQVFGVLAAMSVLLLGAGWFWSAVLNSHGLATGMSFFVLVVVAMGLVGLGFGCGLRNLFENWFVSVCVAVGSGGYIVGCVYYLHRLEP